MNNNDIRTVSFEEVEEFYKNIKPGDVYKIIKRYDDEFDEEAIPCAQLLDNDYDIDGMPDWIDVENNKIVLVLETDLGSIDVSGASATENIDIRDLSIDNLNKWSSFFIKVLYEDQICVIHTGWLEKI